MKKRVKIIIDIVMTGIALFLMVYFHTGQQVHEWLGAAMFILFLMHNILNYKWYTGLFKGKYSVYRIFHTLVNIVLAGCMIGLMISGIIMSRYVFGFLPIHGGMRFARTTHLLCSYWAFVLMSVHLGLHWGMAVSGLKMFMGQKDNRVWKTVISAMAAVAAIYGLYAFIQNDLISYMTFKSEFVFFDPEQTFAGALLEYAAMMVAWAYISYYLAKLLRRIKSVG